MGFDADLTHYGDSGFAKYLRRTFGLSMGFTPALLERPVVGIAATSSDFNNCHRLVPHLVEGVKRGVLAAGGLPMAFPTISLGEAFLTPTSMMFRNLMAMDTEEMIRAQPMDSVVLIGGCDKTLPAQMMGAVSANRPSLVLPVGPMSTGRYNGGRLGACTDCRLYWAQHRAGKLSDKELARVQMNLASTAGTCPVMGTASTMAIALETMGLAVPGAATIPAVHAERLRAAELTGSLAVELARGQGKTPRELVTERSIRNAMRMVLAVGGSTNAIIHLTAIARRNGVDFALRDLNSLSDGTPTIVDLKPNGSAYMEDLHAEGGVPALLDALRDLLELDAPTAWGGSLEDNLASARVDFDHSTAVRAIAPCHQPWQPQGGIVSLFGSLAPDGAVLKRSAADSRLFEIRGRAVVFSSLEELGARVDDPHLDVDETSVLLLQNAGPRAAGMPEAGYLPIPEKLARRGITDIVRVSDARMSGTAYGTVVLHVAPEAAAGGPIGLVRDGDLIELSVARRKIDLLVDRSELRRRHVAANGRASGPSQLRGYARLFRDHVMQAPDGCDFDF